MTFTVTLTHIPHPLKMVLMLLAVLPHMTKVLPCVTVENQCNLRPYVAPSSPISQLTCLPVATLLSLEAASSLPLL
jgi:hypothetical protein